VSKGLRRSLALLLILALSIGGGLAFEAIYTAVEKHLHPMPSAIADTVERYSLLYGVPKNIVYAIIKCESDFATEAESRKNACGLMQLTPDTFDWLQTKTGEEYAVEALYDAEINIKYGVFYLSLLKAEFPVWETVFAAYNAGPNRVREWLENETIGHGGILYNIPFKETRNYVKKVVKTAELYTKLYVEEEWT